MSLPNRSTAVAKAISALHAAAGPDGRTAIVLVEDVNSEPSSLGFPIASVLRCKTFSRIIRESDSGLFLRHTRNYKNFRTEMSLVYLVTPGPPQSTSFLMTSAPNPNSTTSGFCVSHHLFGTKICSDSSEYKLRNN